MSAEDFGRNTYVIFQYFLSSYINGGLDLSNYLDAVDLKNWLYENYNQNYDYIMKAKSDYEAGIDEKTRSNSTLLYYYEFWGPIDNQSTGSDVNEDSFSDYYSEIQRLTKDTDSNIKFNWLLEMIYADEFPYNKRLQFIILEGLK